MVLRLDAVPGVSPPAVGAMVASADGHERDPEEEGQSDIDPCHNLHNFYLLRRTMREKMREVSQKARTRMRKEEKLREHRDRPCGTPIHLLHDQFHRIGRLRRKGSGGRARLRARRQSWRRRRSSGAATRRTTAGGRKGDQRGKVSSDDWTYTSRRRGEALVACSEALEVSRRELTEMNENPRNTSDSVTPNTPQKRE